MPEQHHHHNLVYSHLHKYDIDIIDKHTNHDHDFHHHHGDNGSILIHDHPARYHDDRDGFDQYHAPGHYGPADHDHD